MKKNLYLSSVDYDQEFKRLFKRDTLQYYRNSLRILESSRGPHRKAPRAAGREFDTPGVTDG